jgi:peptidoglycan hydrolase CwlO-like protein
MINSIIGEIVKKEKKILSLKQKIINLENDISTITTEIEQLNRILLNLQLQNN